MFFLGVGVTVIGAAARNIGLTPYQIGLLVAVQNIGLMFSVIVSGALSDSYQKPKILFVGSVVLAISYYTFYLNSSFFLNLLIMFFIGIGIGTYEGVTDPMLLDIHEEREALYINVNHFFVTFGCIAITLYLLYLQMNWRASINQSAFAVALLAIFFVFTELKGSKKAGERLSNRLRFLRQQKIVLILLFATISSVGLELCSISIMTTFLMDLRSLSQVTSKLGLIIFLSGIALGRLFIGFFAKKELIFDLIAFLFGLSAAITVILYFVDAKEFTYVIVFLAGITVSSILPLIIAFAGTIYKDTPGTVLGIIKLGLPIGGIAIPLMLSILSRYYSFKISLLLFPIIALVTFIVLFLCRTEFGSARSVGE
jgi:predicted MFS family arabinose efflux permease